ncbi:MAG: HD domain-containing protein [Fibrobacteres bacterium]|nr:HD domain-containing protein [Fibrobacterota bacterium]
MPTKIEKLLDPLVKKPILGASVIVVFFYLAALLAAFVAGGDVLGSAINFVSAKPVVIPFLIVIPWIPPFFLLTIAKRAFVMTSRNLSVRISEGINQVKETQNVSVLGFTRIAEARDPDTGDHVNRMAHYSKLLAEHLATKKKYEKYITPSYVEEIFISAPLHDIGKVGIKDEILLKEGKLTDREFEIMKMHTILGGNVIGELERKLNFRTFFSLGKEIAYHHHQKWNGKGYPNIFKDDIMIVEEGVGKPLKEEMIPLSARVVALADVYDALVSKRCYKRAFSHEAACDIIAAERGEHFDPDIVDVFLEIHDTFKTIRKRFNK